MAHTVSQQSPSILDYIDARSAMSHLMSELAFGSENPCECAGKARSAIETVSRYRRNGTHRRLSS